MWCCADDESFVALRRRPAGGGVKPPQAALVEARLVNTNVGGGLVADGEPADCGAVRVMKVCLALRYRLAGGGTKPACAAAVNGGAW